MNSRTVTTNKGTQCRVLEAGDGPPLVFLHGAGGLLPENQFLDLLAERFHVYAPELPGFGESEGEELLEDMLDFTLHGLDVLDELGLQAPNVVAHSMGAMIAAEMACVSPPSVGKLVLCSPAGLWLDDHPIPDMFSMLPFELGQALFHDAEKGAGVLTGGVDFNDREALAAFYIANTRRLATAGKLLFPIPNRRLSKRLYRLRSDTLLVWGSSDKLVPPVYAEAWQDHIRQAQLVTIDEAGHMVPWEQPERFAKEVEAFLS